MNDSASASISGAPLHDHGECDHRESVGRSEKALLIALLLTTAVALSYVLLQKGNPSDLLKYRASSAYEGYRTSGQVGEARSSGVFVHTRDEENPWVEIDLDAPKSITRLVVKNRDDCCRERAVPLIAEVRGPDGKLTEVGRKDAAWRKWELSFAPIEAKSVRFSIPRKEFLHLGSVEIE